MHLVGFIIRINTSLCMLFRLIGGGTGGVLDWIICVHYAYKNSVRTSWYFCVIQATTGQ